MFNLPGPLGTLANLLVIILGFGSIIFVHELGHFLAARWAGIRVLAFSMGMGPVLFSYRKGLGWRKGSSEPEYRKVAYGRTDAFVNGISPTEYRFSALPIGGYVKMLGQEDINPGAVSDAPDSYQNRPVWKRMVVISAGVVMNLVTAALLFVWVFMVGLEVQPTTIGRVDPDAPAARALAVGRNDLAPGLLPDDTVLSVDGRTVRGFSELSVEIAMGRRHQPVRLAVQRPGEPLPIEFEAVPEVSPASGFLDLGVQPPVSGTLLEVTDESGWREAARLAGLPGVRPGSALTAVNGEPAANAHAIASAIAASGGGAVTLDFKDPAGEACSVTAQPIRRLQTDTAAPGNLSAEHVLGLAPLLRVHPDAPKEGVKQGLRPGDVFIRIGELEYPSVPDAIAAIRAMEGKPLTIVVERAGPDGTASEVTLDVRVNSKGQIGFLSDSTAASDNRVGRPLRLTESPAKPPPAAALVTRPGSRVLSIGGTPISNLQQVPAAIEAATAAAFADASTQSFTVPVALELPLPDQPDDRRPVHTVEWALSRADVQAVHDLGWTMPNGNAYIDLFQPELVIDKAEGPIAAIGRGLAKSRQVMNQTYLTFLRLFQGTVKVEHLKGPVGIAHLGTKIADQGFIWVLFFLGLVSINLAVINFLPLPIVDGGQFIMLAYEGLRGRPMPIGVQNAVTLVGLVLIGGMFLIVTFHDVKAILGL